MPEKEESKICIPKPEDGKTGIHSSNNGQRSTLKHNISKAGEAFNLKCTASHGEKSKLMSKTNYTRPYAWAKLHENILEWQRHLHVLR